MIAPSLYTSESQSVYKIDFILLTSLTVPYKMQECCLVLSDEKPEFLEVRSQGCTASNCEKECPQPKGLLAVP